MISLLYLVQVPFTTYEFDNILYPNIEDTGIIPSVKLTSLSLSYHTNKELYTQFKYTSPAIINVIIINIKLNFCLIIVNLFIKYK